MADRVNSPNVVNIADLRRLAQRRLPRVVFDYIDGGADGEVTLRENCRAFDDVMFRPRSAVATPNCDLRDDGARRRARAAVHARAGRQQPDVLSARRSSGGARRRRRGHDLHPLDALRLPRRRRRGRRRAGRSGISSIWSAAATSRLRRIERARRLPAAPRSSSRSTRRWPGCANATSATARRSCSRATRGTMLPYRRPVPRPPALARRRSSRDGGLMNFPNVVLPGRGRCRTPTSAPRSSSRWCAGTTSRGFARAGRVRSSSRACTPATTRVAPWTKAPTRVVVSNHGGRQLDGVLATLRVLPEVVAAVERPARGAARRRHPPRQRHRQGALPRRARGPGRTRVRVRTGRGGEAGVRPRHRHPAHRHRPHAEAARLSGDLSARRILRHVSGGVAAGNDCSAVSGESLTESARDRATAYWKSGPSAT